MNYKIWIVSIVWVAAVVFLVHGISKSTGLAMCIDMEPGSECLCQGKDNQFSCKIQYPPWRSWEIRDNKLGWNQGNMPVELLSPYPMKPIRLRMN